MNSTTVVIVDAPDISLAEHEKAGEVLLKFYRALGWNGEDILDPCKVRTTKQVFNKLHDLMYERCPDPVSVGMMMVNRGPGTDDYVPSGKVCLLDGWITPTEYCASSSKCKHYIPEEDNPYPLCDNPACAESTTCNISAHMLTEPYYQH